MPVVSAQFGAAECVVRSSSNSMSLCVCGFLVLVVQNKRMMMLIVQFGCAVCVPIAFRILV